MGGGISRRKFSSRSSKEIKTQWKTKSAQSLETPLLTKEKTWVVKSRILNTGSLEDKYESCGVVLGHGTQGIVNLYKNITTQEEVAVKFIRKENLEKSEVDIEFVNQEIKILMKCQGHDGLLQLYDVFETPENVILVTEYARGGELFRRILSKSSISEAEACHIVIQIVDTLEYLHSQGIVHRDIKPENILLVDRDSDKIKIADFGLAKIMKNNKALKLLTDGQETEHEKLMSTACGTLLYAAPEVIQHKSYNPSVDLWATGILMFLVLAGEMPFDTVEHLCAVNFTTKFEAPAWKFISSEAKDLILKLLQIDPDKRLSCAEIKKHPWIEYVKESGKIPLPISCKTLVALQVAVEARADANRKLFKSVQMDTLIGIFEKHTLEDSDDMCMFRELDNTVEKSGYAIQLEPSQTPSDLEIRNRILRSRFPVTTDEDIKEKVSDTEDYEVINRRDYVKQISLYFDRQQALGKSRRQGISVSGAAMLINPATTTDNDMAPRKMPSINTKLQSGNFQVGLNTTPISKSISHL